MRSPSTWSPWHRVAEGPVGFRTFTLSSAHPEPLGLMLMAWKTLKGQVVSGHAPEHSVNTKKFASKVTEKTSHPKLPWSLGLLLVE